MEAKNSEYWEDRIANETWKTYNSIEEENRALMDMYTKTSDSIKKELFALAEKAEDEGGLGRSQQYRFNKLLGEQGHIWKECEKLGMDVEKHATDQMLKGGKDVYGNIRTSLSDTDFTYPNKKEMVEMMNSPWRGSFFSERLWRDTGKLEQNLNGIINDGISTGKTITEMAVQLSNIMNQSFNNAHRLVRSETINYMNRSAIRGYRDAGVTKVQWWAAEDERTCDVCGQLHTQTFDIDKAPNNPKHSGCRCTWLPVIEETKEVAKELESDTIELEHSMATGENLVGKATRRADIYEYEISDIINQQGFDGLPMVVDKEQFEKCMKDSKFYAERTYAGITEKELEKMQHDLYNGEWYVNCSTGGAQYGRGMYCASSYDLLEIPGIKTEMKKYIDGNISQGNIFHIEEGITLDKSARIIKFENIQEEYAKEWMKKNHPESNDKIEAYMSNKNEEKKLEIKVKSGVATSEEIERYNVVQSKGYKLYDESNISEGIIEANKKMDFGVCAAEMGYDAIRAENSGNSSSYTVILNRTKVVFNKGGAFYGNNG